MTMTPEMMAEAKRKAEEAAAQKKAEREAKKQEKEAKKIERQAAKSAKSANNGVSRPSANTKTGMVWDIADAISQEKSLPAGRKDVLERAIAAGINPATVATQYGRWRKFHGLKGTLGSTTSSDTQAQPAQPAAAK